MDVDATAVVGKSSENLDDFLVGGRIVQVYFLKFLPK